MIDKLTVFVLGAGAGVDYGFPTGRGLANEVYRWIESFDPNRPGEHELRIFPTEAIHDIRSMGRALHTLQGTVDLFLTQHPRLRDVGKFCIARIIAGHENPDQLIGHWYDLLFHRLLPSGRQNASSLAANKVAFITFNYDRSLEEALYLKTKAFFQEPDKACAEALAQLPIIHVHGQFGRLPWQTLAGVLREMPERPYAREIGDPEIFARAACIKITPETTRETPEYARARRLLRDAERVHFLGFGFDPENLSRLRPAPITLGTHKFSGTHLLLGESLKSELQAGGGEFVAPIQFGGFPPTVEEYFRQVI